MEEKEERAWLLLWVTMVTVFGSCHQEVQERTASYVTKEQRTYTISHLLAISLVWKLVLFY